MFIPHYDLQILCLKIRLLNVIKGLKKEAILLQNENFSKNKNKRIKFFLFSKIAQIDRIRKFMALKSIELRMNLVTEIIIEITSVPNKFRFLK